MTKPTGGDMKVVRGKVKRYGVDKGFGFLEVRGASDHFFHINQQKLVVIDVDGVRFVDFDGEPEIPKEGDWVVGVSSSTPGRSQPQLMPWAFAEELEPSFRRVSAVFVEGLRLLGLT
jgi:hypothetical protein